MIPKHIFHPSIVRAYDYRGIVNQTLHIEDARALGRTFGAMLCEELHRQRRPTVCVGFDGRLTSPDLEREIVLGLTEAGADVMRIGVGPTPMLYFTVKHLQSDAGIMITGSHNPPAYNGFKLHQAKAPLLAEDLADIAHKAAEGFGKLSYDGCATFCGSIQTAYVTRLLSDIEKIFSTSNTIKESFSSLRVAWDNGNGAAGQCLYELISQLPGTHRILNGTIDGHFPSHHPDPSDPKNLEQLVKFVKEGNFDLGIAFDGDADRIGVVDAQGAIIWPDRLMAIFAEDILKLHPEATIIGDVKSSQILFETIEKYGGKPLCVRTGHSYIKSAIEKSGALLAGEMSGHIFFKDRYYGFDDALYAALRLLLILAGNSGAHQKSAGQRLQEFVESLPQWVSTPEVRVSCPPEKDKFDVINQMKSVLIKNEEHFFDLDGVRFQDNNGWWLLRASNTEDVLTSRCEARTAKDLKAIESHMQIRLREAGLEWPHSTKN